MIVGPCAFLFGLHLCGAGVDLYDELLRPQFHFTSETNWLNDPNGLVFYRGEYHLFFQHNPTGNQWGNMTWGHAVSRDLVHWTQKADAILPDKLGTIYSGSAAVDVRNTAGFQSGKDPALVAMYTAAGGTSEESKGQPFTQCLAYSRDRGQTWAKYEHNPVLPHQVGENRDPKLVWFEPTRSWIVALFLDGDTYGLFSSPNLKEWTHLQTFHMPGCGECPDFFPMPIKNSAGQKWVFTSANGKYLVGDFDGKSFSFSGLPLQVDFGANYYAVQTFSGMPPKDGRRIQIAWMHGGQYPGMPFNQQMSFPCSMTLALMPEGPRLTRYPVHEISRLYRSKREWSDLHLVPNVDPLSKLSGDLWDIRIGASSQTDSVLELSCRGEPVRIDFGKSTVSCCGRTAPLPGALKKVRLLVDRTSIEVFGNDGAVSLTACFLPKVGAHDLSLTCNGGPVTIESLVVHALKSGWKG